MQQDDRSPTRRLRAARGPAGPATAPTAADGPTVLVVHDDAQTVATIEFALETQGLSATTVDNAPAALRTLVRLRPVLVVLDLATGLDARALHQQIRELCDVPMIVLADPAERAQLDDPATEHLATPFHPRVLAAVAGELAAGDRRTGPRDVLHVGELRIDQVKHVITLAGRRLDFSYTDFKLLAHLAAHRGTPQSWRELHHAVWGTESMLGARDVVKSAIYRVRTRLTRAGGDPDYIRTLHGAGYVMPDLAPVPVLAASSTPTTKAALRARARG